MLRKYVDFFFKSYFPLFIFKLTKKYIQNFEKKKTQTPREIRYYM